MSKLVVLRVDSFEDPLAVTAYVTGRRQHRNRFDGNFPLWRCQMDLDRQCKGGDHQHEYFV
jgi:hypothetical protein